MGANKAYIIKQLVTCRSHAGLPSFKNWCYLVEFCKYYKLITEQVPNTWKVLSLTVAQVLNDPYLDIVEKQATIAELENQLIEIKRTVQKCILNNISAKHALFNKKLTKYWSSINKERSSRNTFQQLQTANPHLTTCTLYRDLTRWSKLWKTSTKTYKLKD